MGNLEFLWFGCVFGKYVLNFLKIVYLIVFIGVEFGWFDYLMFLFVICVFVVDYFWVLKEIDVNVLVLFFGSDCVELKVVYIIDVIF